MARPRGKMAPQGENTFNSERPLSEGRGRQIKARPDRDVKRKGRVCHGMPLGVKILRGKKCNGSSARL